MAAAVIVDPAAFIGFAEDADNYLVLIRVTPGKPFVYYSGAAWDHAAAISRRARHGKACRGTRSGFPALASLAAL